MEDICIGACKMQEQPPGWGVPDGIEQVHWKKGAGGLAVPH